MPAKPHAGVGRMHPAFQRYWRRLPHWRVTEGIYFVTWRLAEFQSELTSEERSIVVAALRHFESQRYNLFAFVVMNDHVHVLVRPSTPHRLEDLIQSWKSFTANRMQRTTGRLGRIWQDEYFDRVIRDDEELIEKAQYVLGNPVKRWPETVEYSWVWSV